MKWLRQHPTMAFGIRFSVLFLALLLPIPWLADSYVTLFSCVGNEVIETVNGDDARFDLTLRPPETIQPRGDWGLELRVVDRETRAVATPKLSVRTFSYLPFATFIALCVASLHVGLRRWVKVFGAGVLLMSVATMFLSSLPVLEKFGILGVLGEVPAKIVATAYQALATPIMLYAIPMFLWWALMSVTRPPATVVTTPNATSRPSSDATVT